MSYFLIQVVGNYERAEYAYELLAFEARLGFATYAVRVLENQKLENEVETGFVQGLVGINVIRLKSI